MQYYTLREAAEKLRMEPERLKEMAKNNQLRAFQDRGTLRFRAQEIDEMARTLGLGSDPDLQLGELLPPKPAKAPKSPPPAGKSPPPAGKSPPPAGKSPPPSSGKAPPSSGKSPPPSSSKSPAPGSRRTMHIPADSDLSLVGDEHDAVPIGNEPSSGRNKPSSSKSKPGSGKRPGDKSPPSPPPAHDSDVRLVSEGGALDFQLEVDDAGNVAQTREQPPATKSPAPKKSKVGPEENPDSGVRIVPLDQASDSDVKIVPDDRAAHDPDVVLDKMKPKTPSDSDVRLELPPTPARRSGQDPFVTEEIELDLEALKEAESKAKRRRPTKSHPELPTTSPFELSAEDATTVPPPKTPKPGKKPKKDDTDSSSDFELTPVKDDSAESPIELGSDEMPIPLAKDDESDEAQVVFGEAKGQGKHDSGINLRDPKDSGISLEEGGSEEFEFGLTADADADVSATPKPGPAMAKPGQPDSSGEFELGLDDSPVGDEHTSSEFELTLDPGTGAEEDSSSEFELSLDPNATTDGSSSDVESDSSTVDSDSEFELSLDASGELAAADESGLSEGGEKDIFETDFEVPALEDESGSEAVALDESDTDLEDSDFELDLSDEDLAAEEESGSQVVALEEDEEASSELETDESGEEVPVSRKPRKKTAATDDFDSPLLDLEDVEGEEAAEEEVEMEPEPGTVPTAPQAPWGIVPALFLVPTFLVMFFVVVMSFEMLNTTWGYHSGGIGARMVIDPVARGLGLMDKDVP